MDIHSSGAFIVITNIDSDSIIICTDIYSHISFDHIREFSCGHLYYRTLYIDPRRELLYIGAILG
ncbi:semaphorin [Dermatophagoides farinae]|uniref:Semaphorin n=1 Tax=Dermatophagoides farinae TaxID=6954 RepID=A0A922HS52_DERFA|nr:semaphorin [Dermatophagoides farinae]